MRFLYTNADGALCVVNAAAKVDIEKLLGALTDEQYKAHVLERSIPAGVSDVVEIADDYELPDREFRDAWKHEKGIVSHDLEKARRLQLERIRLARDPKLAALDVDFIRAVELDDSVKKAQASKAKQALRAITEPLKNAELTSIEDVRAAFPDELK